MADAGGGESSGKIKEIEEGRREKNRGGEIIRNDETAAHWRQKENAQ